MFELIGVLPCDIKSPASRCAPVPQSRISRSPLAVVTSTQDVLPPKWFVPGPGVAIEPRVPQKRTFITSSPSTIRWPPSYATYIWLYVCHDTYVSTGRGARYGANQNTCAVDNAHAA